MPLPLQIGLRKQPVGYDPIHLTATTRLSSNSQGGVNAISLKNPNGEPMELLEVKWQISGDVEGFTGGTVGCKLDMGSLSLTNGFVPIWNFGPTRTIAYEQTENLNEPNTIGFQWKLDHPLYIPAGAVLMPTFQHRGLVANDLDVRISYSCRSSPTGLKPPRLVRVPYVAFYASKSFVTFSEEDFDVSLETDLVNKFDVDLHVHRFLGRLATFAPEDPETPSGIFINNETVQNASSFYYNCRMMDSRGEPIVPRYSPFRQVFCPVTRAWEVSYKMPPQMFIKAFLQKDATVDRDDTYLNQAFISLVGTREVSNA